MSQYKGKFVSTSVALRLVALGYSSSQRVIIPVFAQKRSGTRRFTTSDLRLLEWSVQSFPAGYLLQGTKLTTRSTPETSLEILVLLLDNLAVWKLLPNVSQWVLFTMKKGYRIQFRFRPHHFNGVRPTMVGPEQALVMDQEVKTLLVKGAKESVPPPERESLGFTSSISSFQRRMGDGVRF